MRFRAPPSRASFAARKLGHERVDSVTKMSYFARAPRVCAYFRTRGSQYLQRSVRFCARRSRACVLPDTCGVELSFQCPIPRASAHCARKLGHEGADPVAVMSVFARVPIDARLFGHKVTDSFSAMSASARATPMRAHFRTRECWIFQRSVRFCARRSGTCVSPDTCGAGLSSQCPILRATAYCA